VTEATIGTGAIHDHANIHWGDAVTENWPWTSHTGSGPVLYKVSVSHTYPNLAERTIDVLSDCCTTNSLSASATVDVRFGCSAAPLTGCLDTTSASLLVKNSTDTSKNQIQWKWSKGAATVPADLGDPTTTMPYYFCIYSPGNAGPGHLVSEAKVSPSATNWALAGTTGFKYKDKTGAQGGVTGMSLKTGLDGKASVQVKSKGASIAMPMLPLTEPVIAQLQNNGNKCWTHTFTDPAAKNDGFTFQDKEAP
jgi:hypothetical protein